MLAAKIVFLQYILLFRDEFLIKTVIKQNKADVIMRFMDEKFLRLKNIFFASASIRRI